MKKSDILKGAAELMHAKDMCRGTFYEGDPKNPDKMCIRGAVFLSMGLDPWNSYTNGKPADQDIMDDISCDVLDRSPLDWWWQSPATWNNTEAKDKHDVIRVLDAAYVLSLQEEGIEPSDVLV